MSMYLASNAGGGGDFAGSTASSTPSGSGPPSNSVTTSTTIKPDGARVKTTETSRPDGSKTVVVETTDAQGHRTVEKSEFAACAPVPQSMEPPPSPGGDPYHLEEPPPSPRAAPVAGGVAFGQAMNEPKDDYPEGGQVFMSHPPSQPHGEELDQGFWTKRNKIIVAVLAVAVIAVAVAVPIAVTSGGGSDGNKDRGGIESALEQAGFTNSWPTQEGVLVGPGTQSFSVTTLGLCANQCAQINAPAGFFKEGQGINDPAMCYCEFDSKCLDPAVEVTSGTVFATFSKPSSVCTTSLCDNFPGDELCTPGPTTPSPTPAPAGPGTGTTPFPTPFPTPPTPVSTPFPTPPTPVSTPFPTPPTPPVTEPRAALYYAEMFGVTDPDDLCQRPSPGMTISCGTGGEMQMLNSTNNIQCNPVGSGTLSCTTTITQDSIFVAVVYICVGTSEPAWTTQVDSVPDSVSCSTGGAAGARIYLSQRCPPDSVDDFNQMTCNPTTSLLTNTAGENNCLTFDVCTAATCTLTTPAVGSSVGVNAVSRSCLYNPPSGGSTPSPTPPPPTPPTGGAVLRAWYQAEWFGPTSEQKLCIDPTPGILITCGAGGAISILDTTDSVTCIGVPGREEISCTAVPPNEGEVWGILYECVGSTTQSWTTAVDAVPDTSVSCLGGGAAGTRILIGKRCPDQDGVDYSDVACDPTDALSPLSSGIPTCLTFDICQQATCSLVTPPLGASIPASTITQNCLRP